MLWKTRYITKYSAKYHVFPATFHVISRKSDYLWDSVLGFNIKHHNNLCKSLLHTAHTTIHSLYCTSCTLLLG